MAKWYTEGAETLHGWIRFKVSKAKIKIARFGEQSLYNFNIHNGCSIKLGIIIKCVPNFQKLFFDLTNWKNSAKL